MRASEHLEECIWKHPRDYGGFSPVGDYCILSVNRDSSILDQCNFKVATRELGAEFYAAERPFGYTANDYPDRPNAYVFRAGHWAYGWVEYLIVRHDAPQEMLETAGEIICSLADYPVLDDAAYSDMQWIYAQDSWSHMSMRDRVDLCRECGASIFAARHSDFPSDDNGAILERLAGE